MVVPSRAGPPADASAQQPKSVVWLVEDNIDDEKLTVRSLAKTIFDPTVVVARDGEQALNLVGDFQSSSQLPNLVLLDLKLPKASGFEVLEEIRKSELLRDVPVVILTSSDEPMDVERAWSHGANDYVRKPVDYAGYLAAIASVTNMWLPAKEA